MAADYAPDAVLHRPDATYRGRPAIAGYFATVPGRLGGGEVAFIEPEVGLDGAIVVGWRIVGGPGDGTAGRDHYLVRGGQIVRQSVVLVTGDF